MKLSEIDKKAVKEYLRVYDDDEDSTIDVILSSSKKFIYSYTALTEKEADEHEDLSIACMVLCSDMFDNRSYSVQNNKINPIVDTILHMYAKNYL